MNRHKNFTTNVKEHLDKNLTTYLSILSNDL